MATPPDTGYLPGDTTGFGSTLTQPADWSNQDQANAFKAGNAAELAEAEAGRGDMVTARAQIGVAQTAAALISDPTLSATIQADITTASAWVESQDSNAAAAKADAATSDAGVMANAVRGSDQAAVSQEAASEAELAREQALVAQGFSPSAAFALGNTQQLATDAGAVIEKNAKLIGAGIGIGATVGTAVIAVVALVLCYFYIRGRI